MYQKFIITQDGVLRFGRVYQHCDLLDWGLAAPAAVCAALAFGGGLGAGGGDARVIKGVAVRLLGWNRSCIFA